MEKHEEDNLVFNTNNKIYYYYFFFIIHFLSDLFSLHYFLYIQIPSEEIFRYYGRCSFPTAVLSIPVLPYCVLCQETTEELESTSTRLQETSHTLNCTKEHSHKCFKINYVKCYSMLEICIFFFCLNLLQVLMSSFTLNDHPNAVSHHVLCKQVVYRAKNRPKSLTLSVEIKFDWQYSNLI